MAQTLNEFIRSLQAQDDSDVIYSAPPKEETKIIPPETRIIPPETKPVNPKETIQATQPEAKEPKINMTKPELRVENKKIESNGDNKVELKFNTREPKKPKEVDFKFKEEKKIVFKLEIDPIEELFIKSGTNKAYKEEWVNTFKRAQASKKTNSVAKRMKEGAFQIRESGQITILPDYNMSGKTTSDVLNDKWLKEER